MNEGITKIPTNIPEADSHHLPVERVNHYIYLGHKITLGLEDLEAEVKRRIAQPWTAFGANSQIFRSKRIAQHLKTKVFN